MFLRVKHFNELTAEELFKLYKLRASVFVVEQNCAYQDLDDADLQAYHVWLEDENGIQAYLRVLPKGTVFDEVSLGRVIAVKRRCGLGTQIVKCGIAVAKEKLAAESIAIAAQTYVRKLYENLGFLQTGPEFLEDGIPHIPMILRITTSPLLCPNCGAELTREGRQFVCTSGHSFDCAKEGYVNLLIGSKSGDNRGDSRSSARARHDFLNKGYYACLKDSIADRMQGTVLDICCGEGYYDDYAGEFYGFDISKEMVRLASKRHREPNYHYMVANLSHIPVRDNSIDTAIHLFAPFHGSEFSRVLKEDGVLYSVIPGRKHLWELKQVVYDTPYENDEQAPECKELYLVSRETVTDVVRIGREDLQTLFSMTPYYYRTSAEDRARLESVDFLDLTVSFVILEYRVNPHVG